MIWKLPFILVLLGQMSFTKRYPFNELVAQINRLNTTWTAELSAAINYDNEESLSNKLGAILKTFNGGKAKLTEKDMDNYSLTSISGRRLNSLDKFPQELDLRLKYPNCDSIRMIRSQGECGSCWALATMNSLSDRYCIAKSTQNFVEQKFFSAQDVLECCTECRRGRQNYCLGGEPILAVNFAKEIGISTGELLSYHGFCKPYFLDLTVEPKPSEPKCSDRCSNPEGYAVPYTLDKTKIKSVINGNGEIGMIYALNTGGPVAVGMMVYEDLFTYKSGIYKHIEGKALGGHAVRIIGYGTESGVKYWIVANTWGSRWGEEGYFRILRGFNECNIESETFVSGNWI